MPAFDPTRETAEPKPPAALPMGPAPKLLPPPRLMLPASTEPAKASTDPSVAAAQTDLHAGMYDDGKAKADEKAKEPTKGTKASDLAEQKAALQGLPPEEIEKRREAAKKEAELFTKDKLEAATGDGSGGTLGPAEAAKQRISNARELMIKMEALGLDPASAMDGRVIEAAKKQQEMVDKLAEQASDLSPAARKAAEMAAALRAKGDGKTTKGDRAALDEALKAAGLSREELDKLPAEKRLLVAGFSPDEIADHFTAKDKDADVIQDPANPANNTAPRGTGDIAAGGDKNVDGTIRRPMTTAEADRAIDMNAVLDESWHAGNKFGKIIPQASVAGLMSGKPYAPGLAGDVGERLNTDLNAQRTGPATGADQVQAAGLDYNTSPYTNATGTDVSKFVKDDQVHRLEGTIDKDIESKAEVALGAGVFARAQQRAAALETAHAAGPASGEGEVFVPKMLRTSTAEDAGDSLPGIMRRTRGEAGNNTIGGVAHPEIDPRTGLGYSMTERLGQDVIPNQERKMRSPVPLAGHADDATVTRSDDHQAKLKLAADGKTMVPAGGLSPADQALYSDPEAVKDSGK